MLKTPEFWIALGGTALAVAILVLRFIAPRTATKKDDEVLEDLEKAADFTGVKLPPKADSEHAKTSQAVQVAPKPGPTVRDHR